jgi:hypothetical protein
MVADAKVSLSGEIASCGMEGNEENCPVPGNHLTSHCCENHINIAGVVNIFTMADPVPDYNIRYNSHSILSSEQDHYSISFLSAPSNTSYHPPGSFLTSLVSLENICVYRI